MSDVPTELIFSILSRVPAESLLRFRCICKDWCRIIDGPDFIKSHLHRQKDGGDQQLILINEEGTTEFYNLSLDSLYNHSEKSNNTKIIEATHLKALPLTVQRVPSLLLPQCNGLFLIIERKQSEWTLWNPFTRECRQLPSYETVREDLGGFPCVGMGYDSVSDDYKIVRIGLRFDAIKVSLVDMKKCFGGEILVYSLKSDSWRFVMDCPFIIPSHIVPGVFVNGALHWTISRIGEEEKHLIFAFNLAAENYCLLPLPFKFGQNSIFSLDVLNDCLVISCHSSIYRLDNYGGENTWTLLFSFRDMGLGTIRPLAFLKSKGEVLLQYVKWTRRKCLFWFDIEKKSIKKVLVDGASDLPYSQMCLASLVRLNKSGRVDGSNGSNAPAIKERKWKSAANDRLKLTLTIRNCVKDN